MQHKIMMGWMAAGCMILAAGQDAGANAIAVTNTALVNMNSDVKTVDVCFDVRWSNSWRTADNWDAAWVFVKFKPQGSNEWFHATLSTNSADHAPAANGVIAAVSDGKGAFVLRSSAYTGGVNYASTKLKWNYNADGYSFTNGEPVNVAVHAIEMVYIPTGSFYVGSGGGETSPFYEYPTTTTPYLVSSTNAITVGTTAGNLYYLSSTYGGDRLGPISNSFPNGYRAFYCMKYEISQGQYASFLNYLTAPQASMLYSTNNGNYRNTISGSYANYSASAPDRACNYLSWMDGCSYADWAGLRPMTELEFEKACRGAAYPVSNEYAWGTNTIIADSGDRTINVYSPSGLENGTETNATDVSLGAAVYGNRQIGLAGVNAGLGPVRCGLFATANSGRISSGSTYWGIMEMSGNLWERPVTVGNPEGRTFRGTCGDGVLSTNGYANNSDWPGYSGGQVTGATGAGFRGGAWNNAAA